MHDDDDDDDDNDHDHDEHDDDHLSTKGDTMAATLTVGMAHFDDYDGVYFTVQALALYHSLEGIEILIVDNSPDKPSGQAVKTLCENWAGAGANVKYVPMPDTVGTSAPRDRVFREASGDAVVCMDCHVFLPAGVLQRLRRWYADNPDCLDLVQGPLLYDVACADPFGHDVPISTHFDLTWRAEMWGTWQTDDRGRDPDAEPFDIPSQGLGLFSCRREAWLGFNEHFRGFGGEEGYIHEKFRKAGRRAICVPWLRWGHRFGRPGGVKYPLSRWNKVRNYVLGHTELDMDLAPVREHFVDSGLMPVEQWDYLVEDPAGREHPPGLVPEPATVPAAGGCGSGGASRSQPPEGATLDQIFEWCKNTPRDLDQHLDKLSELAKGQRHVTELTKRRESTVGLLAGRPKFLVSWQREPDPLQKTLHNVLELPIDTYTSHAGNHGGLPDVEPTDVLFIDDVHHGEVLHGQLTKYADVVRKRIVLRGTGAFAERAEGGNGPGLLAGLRRFMRERPEWSVIYHTAEQYGLTVISRLKKDKPDLPSAVEMAKNLVGTLADHVADGLGRATREQLQARLELCTLCENRVDKRCGACGCYISKKAPIRTADCPLGKWPALPEEATNDG